METRSRNSLEFFSTASWLPVTVDVAIQYKTRSQEILQRRENFSRNFRNTFLFSIRASLKSSSFKAIRLNDLPPQNLQKPSSSTNREDQSLQFDLENRPSRSLAHQAAQLSLIIISETLSREDYRLPRASGHRSARGSMDRAIDTASLLTWIGTSEDSWRNFKFCHTCDGFAKEIKQGRNLTRDRDKV